MSIIGAAENAVVGTLGGVWGYVAAFGVALVIGGVGAGWTVHKVDQGKYDDLVISQKQALIDAQTIATLRQKNSDIMNQQAAVQEAVNQQRIVDDSNRLIQKVPVYVTAKQDADTCITYGLVRVLDAAAIGTDPEQLPLASGQSNDACAPVKASALAASVASNYGLANQNAEQLNALEADVVKLHDINESTTQAPTSKPGWLARTFGNPF